MADNKVITVQLYGGLVGLFGGSPRHALQRSIRSANSKGYEVVQVIESSSGNIAVNILRAVLLILTVFIFTFGNGYYVILRKADGKKFNSGNSNAGLGAVAQSKELEVEQEVDNSLDFLEDKKCASCDFDVLEDAKFCENCGKPQ